MLSPRLAVLHRDAFNRGSTAQHGRPRRAPQRLHPRRPRSRPRQGDGVRTGVASRPHDDPLVSERVVVTTATLLGSTGYPTARRAAGTTTSSSTTRPEVR